MDGIKGRGHNNLGCSPSVFLAKLLHFFLALQCSEVSMAQLRITQLVLHLGRGSGNSVHPSAPSVS